jgi:hypothetical protein
MAGSLLKDNFIVPANAMIDFGITAANAMPNHLTENQPLSDNFLPETGQTSEKFS